MTAAAPGSSAGAGGEKRLIAALLLPSIPLYACFGGMQQILQPAQIEAIDPASKIAHLALLTAASSVTAVLGLVAGGTISDRTQSRWGRRNPWIVVMALMAAGLILLAGRGAPIAVLIGVYCAMWLCLNFHQAAMTAVLPDRVSPSHRALASSAIGLATPLGILLGVNLAGRLAPGLAFPALAGLLVVGSTGFALAAPEPAAANDPHPRPPGATRAGGGLFAAFRHRDFTFAFVSRAMLFLAYFSVNGYLLYAVKDRIALADLPGRNAGVAVSILGSISMIAWIAGVPFAGWLADRFNRRKRVVSIAAIGMALAMIPPIVSPSWPALTAFAALDGLFFGIYLAVDLALMSLVLPDRRTQGRDMAILNVASAGSQIFAPLLAGGLIATLGYTAMFAATAALALGGGLFVLAIRGVR